jgi:iron-sulfur cluster repair protein YtfE (RIC family)
MSSAFIDTSEVRERILAEHRLLRTMISNVATTAEETLRHREQQPHLCAALATLRSAIERHLDYEERVLAPVLLRADAWGPVRAAHMTTEHAGQRALLLALTLLAVTEDAGGGVRSATGLVDEIQGFVQSFERNMREQEAMLLSAEALGEEVVVVDQIDG